MGGYFIGFAPDMSLEHAREIAQDMVDRRIETVLYIVQYPWPNDRGHFIRESVDGINCIVVDTIQ